MNKVMDSYHVLVYAEINIKKKVQYKGVLIAGIITLLIPVSFTVFLIVGVMLGLGPVPG